MEVVGHNGQLVVEQNKIILKSKGVLGFLTKGAKGDKEIAIKSITAIQFKKAGMLSNGMIQFSIQGETAHKGGLFDNSHVNDENTILFTKKQQPDFEKAKTLIEAAMDKLTQPAETKSISTADELAKFADLKKSGVITEDEFNQKKKELLGL